MSDFTSFDPAAVIAGTKRGWRCVTHDKGPQSLPIVIYEESCRIQVLGWFDEITVRGDDGKVTARQYRDPNRVVPDDYERLMRIKDVMDNYLSDEMVPMSELLEAFGQGVITRIPMDCDGTIRCDAMLHIHGCYADRGVCDAPDHFDKGEA